MPTSEQNINLVRRPQFAGSLYPADPLELESRVKEILPAMRLGQEQARPVALLLPADEELYQTAAVIAALAAIRGARFETAVVIASAQQALFDHAAVFDGGAYDSPLGRVYANLELAARIAAIHPQVRISASGHVGSKESESTIELALPLLQTALRDFRIVPIVLGNDEANLAISVAEAVAAVVDRSSTLVVGLANLAMLAEPNRERMAGLEKALAGLNWEGLRDRAESSPPSLSGAASTISLLYAARRLGGTRAEVALSLKESRLVSCNGAFFPKQV